MKFLENQKISKLINQILKFGIVGGIAFVIDYSILYILTEFGGIDSLISAAIAFTISVIFNYMASIKWVFDVNKKQTKKDVIIFFGLSIIGLGINELIIYIGNNINIHYMISKLASTFIVMIYNFITRKIFIEKN